MRTALCILLLSPCLAFAGVYKCLVNGQVNYMSQPCGEVAQPVENKLVVIPAQKLSDRETARIRARRAGEPGTSASAPSATAGKTDCQSRMQQYNDAQACFAKSRINARQFKQEAYETCPDVPYPSDCAGQ